MHKKRFLLYYRVFAFSLLAIIILLSTDIQFASTETVTWSGLKIQFVPAALIILAILVVSYPIFRYLKKRINS